MNRKSWQKCFGNLIMLVLLVMLGGFFFPANAEYIITTIAGGGNNGLGDDEPATNAQLSQPSGVAVDSSGNIYIADSGNNRIRKIDISGKIFTIVGVGTQGFSGDNGPASNSQIWWPAGIVFDSNGDLYFLDSGNWCLRKVNASDTKISTITHLNASNLAIDSSRNLYIANWWNHRIRKLDTLGNISTVAGLDGEPGLDKGGFSGDGGPATSAQLNTPWGIAVDSSGNLLIVDQLNHRIRKMNASDGKISTVAGSGAVGNGNGGFSGDGGPATSAQLNTPWGIAVDNSDNIYIADTNNQRIRKVNGTDGRISTVVGNGIQGFSGDGGPAISAQLSSPISIAIDSKGNFYIADMSNNRIRKVTFAPTCITQAQLEQAVKAEQLKWDANGDGKIGLEDIIRMLQVLAGLRP